MKNIKIFNVSFVDNNKILSICIPTYNRADFLLDCLNSIVEQFSDDAVLSQVEIVISDNYSLDNTGGVVKKFQEKYKNIKYFKNKSNIGFDRNLLNTIEKSSGEYCLTLGDDDAIFPGALSLLLNKIQTIKASYFILNSWGYDHFLNNPVLSHPNRRIYEDIIFPKLNDFVKTIKNYRGLVGSFGGMSAQLFQREQWLRFRKKDDYVGTNTIHLFILLSIFKNSKFALISTPLIKTRNDNLRWQTFPGLETNIKRIMATSDGVMWISDLYDLNISRTKVLSYFFVYGFWVSLKQLIKKILIAIRIKHQ